MTSSLPYLRRRADTPGWFFIRRVPVDLVEQVGKQHWRWLLAQDLPTARLRLPEALAETDRLIATLRGEEGASRGSQRPLRGDPVQTTITRAQDRLLLQGRPALIQELADIGAPLPDDAADLARLPQATCGHTPVFSEDLLELGVRLKQPAPQTVLAWERALEEFSRWLGHSHLQMVTRQDTAAFRDHLLAKGLKVSTIKLRLNYLGGLFTLAAEEELVSSNPFQGVGKRLKAGSAWTASEATTTTRAELDVEAIPIHKLPPLQQSLFQLLRFTGCRLAEGAGLELGDIDLQRGLIEIKPKPDRPLKTRESERLIPIHSRLMPTLETLTDQRPWASLHNPQTHRWGGGLTWTPIIGLSPHQLRHAAASAMRAAGASEVVIGKVLGHRVPGTTARYGSASFELLREAIEAIR